jgi:hypothetical protein
MCYDYSSIDYESEQEPLVMIYCHDCGNADWTPEHSLNPIGMGPGKSIFKRMVRALSDIEACLNHHYGDDESWIGELSTEEYIALIEYAESQAIMRLGGFLIDGRRSPRLKKRVVTK